MTERIRQELDRLAEHEPWERGHAERVAVYATATAYQLGFRGERLVEIRIAAEAHDIGKAVLLGKARAEASELWRRHPGAGATFLSDHPEAVQEAVLHHHERLDGSGYPEGLRGTEVTQAAQVLGIAEWFDVARHGSPFSEARSLDSVREELLAKSGVWFDAEVIDALLAVQRVIQPVGT